MARPRRLAAVLDGHRAAGDEAEIAVEEAAPDEQLRREPRPGEPVAERRQRFVDPAPSIARIAFEELVVRVSGQDEIAVAGQRPEPLQLSVKSRERRRRALGEW